MFIIQIREIYENISFHSATNIWIYGQITDIGAFFRYTVEFKQMDVIMWYSEKVGEILCIIGGCEDFLIGPEDPANLEGYKRIYLYPDETCFDMASVYSLKLSWSWFWFVLCVFGLFDKQWLGFTHLLGFFALLWSN